MDSSVSRRGIIALSLLPLCGIAVASKHSIALAGGEGGGGGGHEDGGDGGGGSGWDLGWGYAWDWFDELEDHNGTVGKDATFEQGWNTASADYFWNNRIPLRIKEIFDERAAVNGISGGDKQPTPVLTAYKDWFYEAAEEALANARRRADQPDARIIGVGWTLGFTGNPTNSSVGRWYMSNDTTGRTFTRLLGKDDVRAYNAHGGEAGIGWFAVGNGMSDLGTNSSNLKKAWQQDKISQSVINDAAAGERWPDYIYRMGQNDNQGSHYTWVVVAVAKGWPSPESGFMNVYKDTAF